LSGRDAPVLRCVHLAVPKDPSFPDEIEDACAFDEATGLVAVVDGASTGFDPVAWSRNIAAAALASADDTGPLEMESIVRRARQAWGERDAPRLPPGIRAKQTGATVGVVRVRRSGDRRELAGVFIGDVNMMICRTGRLPGVPADLALGSNYTSSPETLNTEERRSITVRHVDGVRVVPGDVVLLFTDGFGKWLVDRAGCPSVLDHILSIDARSFISLVRDEQAAHRMELDDVVMVRSVVQ